MRKLNWKPGRPRRAIKLKYRYPQIPPSMDLRSFDSPVFDQGEEGSCTANAAAGAFEFLELQELRLKQPGAEVFPDGKFDFASRQFQYWCERAIDGSTSEDAGSSNSSAVQSLKVNGLCRESLWPYDPNTLFVKPSPEAFQEAALHKAVDDYQLDNTNLTELQACLAAGFPFTIGITVYDSFQSPEVAQSGMVPLPSPDENVAGGHSMLCVGYYNSKQAFLVKNSWGTGWGIAGYCWIPYSYLTDPGLASDFWTIRRAPGF